MNKFFLSAICILVAAPALGSIPSQQKNHRNRGGVPANLEMWCGSSTGSEKGSFPYLAAIHNYRSHSGMLTQTATIYEKGKPVLREYVYQTYKSNHFTYEDSGDNFSLTFDSSRPQQISRADLKAVIRDADGDKLIGNGAMSCYKVHKS